MIWSLLLMQLSLVAAGFLLGLLCGQGGKPHDDRKEASRED